MKFLALFLSLTFSTMAFSNSTVESVELKPDFRVPVNMYVTLNNGCEYWVEGWIDVSFSFPGGFSVNSYNLNGVGGCGEFNISGMIAPPPVDDPNVEVDEATLIELVTKIVDDNIEE